MAQRKHRVIVDVTFNYPVTERIAAKAITLVLADADHQASFQHWPNEIVKMETKEASRVFRAERAKALEAGEVFANPFPGYEAEGIRCDDDGYLIEAALAGNAAMLNDDGTVFAFKQEDLIALLRCAINQNFAPLYEATRRRTALAAQQEVRKRLEARS